MSFTPRMTLAVRVLALDSWTNEAALIASGISERTLRALRARGVADMRVVRDGRAGGVRVQWSLSDFASDIVNSVRP